MRIHDPEAFEAHRIRTEEHLIYIASLIGCTLEEAIARNWQMDTEIDDGVEIPADTPTREAPKKRGRKPGSTTKPPESAALQAAVEFVGVVELDTFEASRYCKFKNNILSA